MAPSREALAIAQIVFFGPVIVAAFLVCLRHGFSRDFGWVSLLLLSAARIAGSACEIAVNTSTPSVGLVTASLILNSGGLSALLLAMLGILKRVHEGMAEGARVPQRIFNFLSTPMLVGLILAIVGGIKETIANEASRNSGKSLTQAAIVIFVIAFVIQSAITAFTFAKIRAIAKGETVLAFAVAASIPFVLVRCIYSLLAVFSGNPSFGILSGDVYIRGFMSIFEEFVTVILYLVAGLMVGKVADREAQTGHHQTKAKYSGAGPEAVQYESNPDYSRAGSEAGYIRNPPRDYPKRQEREFRVHGPISLLIHHLRKQRSRQ